MIINKLGKTLEQSSPLEKGGQGDLSLCQREKIPLPPFPKGDKELHKILKDPKGCTVAVVGAGVSGQSAASLLRQLGASVTLLDEKTGGPIADSALLEFDFIVLSPGFPRSKPCILAALAKKVPIINEMDLAFEHLPNCRFIGVTGTNGKSTTTAMIGQVLKAKDPQAFVGGNLGTPLCDAVLKGEKPSFAVVELSSFQLETLSQLQLDVAVVTHLTPDHLDRYANEKDYFCTKNRIFDLLKPEGQAVINQKDPNSLKFLHPTQHQVGFNVPLSFTLPKVVGAHNLENAAAAFAATRALGFTPAEIEKSLVDFEGMPHRLEFLGLYEGVRWFNDSKATNVESAIIAVKSFEMGIHLILGGVGKGSSYAPLVEACKNRVKCVYLIGEDAPNISAALEGHFEILNAGTLEDAIHAATHRAVPQDVILLAPACASYDQYANYAARGDHMRELFLKCSGGQHA